MDKEHLMIIAKARYVVYEIFDKAIDPGFVFHTLEHTRQVVKNAETIADFYQFKKDEKFILLLAAWFHDTGFCKGRIEGHESESCQIAADFLQSNSIGNGVLDGVLGCIQATREPQSPEKGIEKIICDADLFHLGTINFQLRTKLLKQEFQFFYNREINEKEWHLQYLEFLKSHYYYTGYCQQLLEPVKQKWIAKLQNKMFAHS